MVRDKRIVNLKMVISDLKDPRGWTLENNLYPPDESLRLYHFKEDGTHWSDWFEWLPDGTKICHNCISRAKYGSGNCRDGGPYFICLPEDVRTGKVPYKKPVKTVQTKLW